MSSGDGGGLFETLKPNTLSGKGNFVDNLFVDILNYGTQTATGGLVGFDTEGNFKAGQTTELAKNIGRETVSGLKEITGAKAAEEANKMAQQQFDQEKANMDKQRVEAQNNVARDQVTQSRMAGAARRSTVGSMSSFSLGGDEKDFLGI